MTGSEKDGLRENASEYGLAGMRGIMAGVQQPGAAVPIWFAALIGAHCQALVDGQPQTVQWNCVSGRAQYTNFGPDTVVIQPLGVCLHGGHTLAVSWAPGESAYTMQVFRALDYLI